MEFKSILLHGISPEQFYEQIRIIVKEELKAELMKDQLLTREGALKMMGISNAKFLKAINEGVVKPQLVKGRKRAMYLESEVLKIQKIKRQNS